MRAAIRKTTMKLALARVSGKMDEADGMRNGPGARDDVVARLESRLKEQQFPSKKLANDCKPPTNLPWSNRSC